ncbi:MAG TPA: hypothetical protein ENK18_11745, partial [Deltaproteobacteria bacterium]|nr:hypothetical protein [Deltaproteobacteria bacterium]
MIVSLLTSCWSTAGVQPCNDPRVWYEPVPDGDVAWGCLPPAGWLEAPPLAGGEDLELYEPPPGPTGLPLLDTGSFTPSLASPPLPSADTVDTGWWWTTAVTGATADTAPLDTAPLDTAPLDTAPLDT